MLLICHDTDNNNISNSNSNSSSNNNSSNSNNNNGNNGNNNSNTITDPELSSFIKAKCGKVLVIGSHSCPACQSLLHDINNDPSFEFLDIGLSDIARKLADIYKIQAVPSLILVECIGKDSSGNQNQNQNQSQSQSQSKNQEAIACRLTATFDDVDECFSFQ